MTNEHTLSSGRMEGGQNSGWAGILTDSSTAGRGGNTTSGTSSKGGAPSFSTEPLECIPQTLDSIVRPMLGAELPAPQEVRRGQQHDDGLYPNGDQATLPLPIGHPAPRSCRGNDACTTGRPLQTLGLLQVLVCQTISRNQCGHLHLAGNLVAMSATHSTNQVSTRCWLGTLPLRLRSTSVILSKPLNNFTQISSEPLFSESWGQIQLGWRQPRGASLFPP